MYKHFSYFINIIIKLIDMLLFKSWTHILYRISFVYTKSFHPLTIFFTDSYKPDKCFLFLPASV